MAQDASSHRKSVIATAAVSIILATDSEQGLDWGGVTIEGHFVWIFIGLAHLYFAVMWWSNVGFGGWFPWRDGWRGTLAIRPRKDLLNRWLTKGPFTMIAVIVGFIVVGYHLSVIVWRFLCLS